MAAVCPACGSSDITLAALQDYEAQTAVCMACVTIFEPDSRADPQRQMCDNCAFRHGSVERSDPYGWWAIVEATIVEALHPFHCHKNLPCSFDGQGLHFTLPPGGQAALTPCAGWRSRKIAYDAGVHWSRL